MFKKLKSGALIIILIVLMIIYLLVRYSGSSDRTFRDKILVFEPSLITQIIVDDPKSDLEPVDLRSSGGAWTVRVDGRDFPADTNVIKGILRQLSELPTKRYAGKGQDTWIKYDLTDTLAPLVTLKAGSKTVGDILIGKFSYNMPQGQPQQMQGRQQRGEMTSYVRLADEKDVYAVDGYLKMSISTDINAYRYRNLVNVSPSDITRISVREPGGSKIFEIQGGKWVVDGMEADSTQLARYCNSISRLTGSKFADQQDGSGLPSHTLKIEGNNFSPVELQAFPAADTNLAYIITSSANPGAYFSGKDGGLFRKVWEVSQLTTDR